MGRKNLEWSNWGWSYTEDAVDHSEAHLHEGHWVVLESLKGLTRRIVSEPAANTQTSGPDSKRWISPDSGQGDETEVRRLYGRPAFPVSEQESSREDEGED